MTDDTRTVTGTIGGLSRRAKIAMAITLTAVFISLGLRTGRTHSDFPAPSFTLQDIHGETVSLDDLRGKVVLLDFWATWCPPCRKSIPKLVNLQREYESRGLVILAVSLDETSRLDDRKLISFIKKNDINYSVIRYTYKIMQDYIGDESISIPTKFVIDRDGVVRDKLVGFRPGELEKSLEAVM